MAARKSRSVPAPTRGAGLGAIAYAACSAAVGGKSVTGMKLPTWGDQVESNPTVAAAWCAVGQAVIAATIGRND